MKRGAPLKRTAWKRKPREKHRAPADMGIPVSAPACTGNEPAATKPVAKQRGTYTSTPGRAAPKPEAHRNTHLLAMAKGKPCLLCQEHGVALCTPGSTVAAHSNLGIHGKAMSRKADDFYSAWLGDAHHRWLDQGKGSAAQREMAFMTAHLAQVRAWRAIAFDSRSNPKDRAAAQWALERLNATPVGEPT